MFGLANSHPNETSFQFTLTCISTGGPATTVTWTRDSANVTEGTQTVLNDPMTAQYTHTLNVTTAGEYTCTVANDKPSNDSVTIFVSGMYNSSHFVSYPILSHRPESECGIILCNSYIIYNLMDTIGHCNHLCCLLPHCQHQLFH